MANAGEVVVGISASIDGIQSALDTAKQQIKQFASDAQAAGKGATMTGVEDGLKRVGNGARDAGKATQQFGADTQKGANDATMAFVAVAAAAKTAFDGIKNAVNDGIAAAQAYQAAMIGLNSVAQGRGIGAEAIQTETAKVVDAFFSAADAATAYKNLLTRGYSLEQATDTITRLKDAAAFGRQASMGFAQSIVSATEGLRNENSILVDNSGVTKNVVKMWQDYAKARGLATTEMTQAQKVEAEYLGIMQETALQTGDFQKMTKTLAGDQANAAQQSLLAAQSFGEAMTPMVSAGEQIKAGVLGTLKELTTTFPEVTAGATTAAGAFTLLVGAVAAFKAASKLSGDIGMATSILSPLGKVAAVLGVVVALYSAYQNAVEAAKKAEEERKQANIEAADAAKKNVTALDDLVARYKNLTSRSSLTLAEMLELKQIQEQLQSDYGITAKSVDGLAGSYDSLTASIKAAREEAEKKSAAAQAKVTADKEADAINSTKDAYKDAAYWYQKLSQSRATYANAESEGRINDLGTIQQTIDYQEAQWKQATGPLTQASSQFLDWFLALTETNAATVKEAGQNWNDELAQELANMFSLDPAKFADMTDASGAQNAAQEYVLNAANSLMEAVRSPEVSAALEAGQEFHEKVLDGYQPTEDDYEAVASSYDLLRQTIAEALSAITGEEILPDSSEVAKFLSDLGVPEAVTKSWDDFSSTMTAAAYKGSDGFDYLNSSAQDWNKQQKTLINRSTSLTNQYNEASRQLGVYEKGMAAVQKAQKSGVKLTQDDQDALSALRKEVNYSGDDLNMLAQLTKNAATKTKTGMDNMSNSVVALQTDFGNLQASANVRGDVQVDTSAAATALSGLAVIAAGLLALLSALGVVSGETSAPKPSGGGGGKKDDEEEAKRKAEQARKDAIEADYRAIEHRRTMNEISFEEELAQLEELRRKHRLNAEEMMDWEEKVHEVQQEIRDRDTDSVDTLTEGIISALQNRYESMRDAELARLDESRKAWEDWKDSNVASIQAQIDALDDLTESEDRETQKAEKLRKVASLKEQLTYEQDAYNRAKLQQQLDAAQKAYDDLVTKYDRADQKKALQDQITAVENQADSALDAIDQQEDAINAAYDERLKAASLQAEAEKVLMSNTQQQIIDLIAAYAPDYNATGQNLGEQLYQGFLGRVGNIANWFASFNASIDQLQDAAASAVTSATGSFYADHNGQTQTAAPPTVVYQTVNYNQPAETPSQTARRLAEANEALAQEIASVL